MAGHDDDFLTAERLAKGGLSLHYGDDARSGERVMTSASVADTTILGLLIRRGVLQEFHRSYADDWLEMRDAFLRRVSAKTNPLFADYGPGSGFNETLYLRVGRKLGRCNEKMVEFATAEGSLNRPHLLVVGVDAYRVAFDALPGSIDEARKELAKTLKS